MGSLALAAWIGCTTCEGTLVPLDGDDAPLGPGEQRTYALAWRGRQLRFDDCDGYFEVNGVQGGLGWLGTIDACGVYTAPLVPPDEVVVITGATDPPGGCADCCPRGSTTVALRAAPPPPTTPTTTTRPPAPWQEPPHPTTEPLPPPPPIPCETLSVADAGGWLGEVRGTIEGTYYGGGYVADCFPTPCQGRVVAQLEVSPAVVATLQGACSYEPIEAELRCEGGWLVGAARMNICGQTGNARLLLAPVGPGAIEGTIEFAESEADGSYAWFGGRFSLAPGVPMDSGGSGTPHSGN